MDGVQALIFKPGRRPATSWAMYPARRASGVQVVNDVRSSKQIYVEFNELDSVTCENDAEVYKRLKNCRF